MIIIENENEPIGDGSQFVEQRRQQRVGRRLRLRNVKRGQYALPKFRRDRLHGRHEVQQKASQVAVGFIQ